jgi:arginyl-tRNA synthetase
MAANEEFTGNLKRQLAKLFDVSLKLTVPDEPSVEPLVAASALGKFGDYQCNNAMGLWSIIKGKGTQFKGPPAVGQVRLFGLYNFVAFGMFFNFYSDPFFT